MSEVLVLGVVMERGEVALIQPDRDVTNRLEEFCSVFDCSCQIKILLPSILMLSHLNLKEY